MSHYHRFRKTLLLVIAVSVCAFSGCSTLNTAQLSTQDQEKALLQLSSVVPILSSIAHELCHGTLIETTHLVPIRYSIKRIPGWVKRQSVESFPHSDITLGMSSVWPTIDIYPFQRAKNMRIIPIDAAEALIPGGERVAVTPTDGLPAYFWLSPANAMVMVGIIHRDLLSIIDQSDLPASEKKKTTQTLKNNFLNMIQSLRVVQIEIDQILQSHDLMQVVADRKELSALAAATLLPVTTFEEATSSDFKSLLITSKSKNHPSMTVLPEHILTWHIDDFAKLRAGSFTERWKKSLLALKEIEKNQNTSSETP